MNGATDSNSTTNYLLGLITLIIGVAVGAYAAAFVFVPLIGTLVAAILAMKLFSAEKRFIVPAFAVQAGHLIWFGLGVMLAGTVNNAVLLDVLVLAAGLIWLVAAPGYVPIAALAGFQLFATWINADALLAADWASISHKALLVHLALRFLALVFLGHAALTLYGRRRLGHDR